MKKEDPSLERANNAGSVFAGIEEIETSYRRNVLGVGRNRKKKCCFWGKFTLILKWFEWPLKASKRHSLD